MTKRLRQHVNPLKMTSLVPRDRAPVLPEGASVEVELGCGDAQFLIQRAAEQPAVFHLGLDIRDEFLAFGRQAIAELGLENVRLELSNLIVDLPGLFPPGRVARFFINFPDPWFKARHQNRRWLDQRAVGLLLQALAPGGQLLYQTDVWDLALEAMGLLEAEPGLENLAGEWSFCKAPPFSQTTNREDCCLAEGMRIWRLLFQKRG